MLGLDMGPSRTGCVPISDAAYGAVTHSVDLRQFLASLRRCANSLYLVFGQFGIRRFASITEREKAIFNIPLFIRLARNVFEVVQGRVHFVVVSMMALMTRHWRPQKGLSHENMHRSPMRLSAIPQHYAGIEPPTGGCSVRSQDASNGGPKRCFITSDAAKGRDTIDTLEADNRSPFLIHLYMSSLLLLPLYSASQCQCNQGGNYVVGVAESCEAGRRCVERLQLWQRELVAA